MKALTVRQPYASLISLGVKTIETRTKPTKYRGELLIHAGKAEAFQHGVDIGEWRAYRGDRADRPGAQPARMYGHRPSNEERFVLPLGVIVASCKLMDCVPIIGAYDPFPSMAVHGEGRVIRLFSDHSMSLVYYNSLGTRSQGVGDQRPYGDFTPGRYAWLLEDIQPVEKRCPACEGDGLILRSDNDCDGYDCPCPDCSEPCPVCNGATRCDPIPARGKQGLWNWTP